MSDLTEPMTVVAVRGGLETSMMGGPVSFADVIVELRGLNGSAELLASIDHQPKVGDVLHVDLRRAS